MSGLDFLHRHGATRTTRRGAIPTRTKAEWLADYEQMLSTGCNALGEILSDAQLKQVEAQATQWRSELARDVLVSK